MYRLGDGHLLFVSHFLSDSEGLKWKCDSAIAQTNIGLAISKKGKQHKLVLSESRKRGWVRHRWDLEEDSLNQQ